MGGVLVLSCSKSFSTAHPLILLKNPETSFRKPFRADNVWLVKGIIVVQHR